MTAREAIERLKAMRARTRSKLDRKAIEYAIAEIEDWLTDTSVEHTDTERP